MIGGYSGLPTSPQLADIEEASADLRKGRRGDQSAICPQPRFHCRADTPELVVNGMVRLRHLLTEKFGIPWLARRHKAFVLYGKFDFFVEEKQGLVSRENRACLVSKDYIHRPSKARHFQGTKPGEGTDMTLIDQC